MHRVHTKLRGIENNGRCARSPRLVLLFHIAMLITLAPCLGSIAAAQALAEYALTPGWATFGLALPPGAAHDRVTVMGLPTQTDVKVRWPDASIRFAVVTARVTTAGTYTILPSGTASPAITPAPPALRVRLTINGQVWTALVAGSSADTWLAGGLVREARYSLVPAANGTLHPFLRVLADVRSYGDGAHRVDVTVENVLDVAGATRVVYDVSVDAGGPVLFARTAVSHWYLTRWRKTVMVGGTESAVVPDFKPFIAAQAVPRYAATVVAPARQVQDAKYGILQVGDLRVPMNDVGGRPEIAPYPDWTAQYLVHRRADQRDYMLRHGELAGSWAIHLREPDGVRLVTIDAHPDYWFDARAEFATNRPKGDLNQTGPGADLAHQPSLAFVPYLVTGDRYFADEVAFWANYSLLKTYQDSGYYNSRGGGPGLYTPTAGSQGLLFDHEPRAFGWALRNLADAAAYVPDASPYRAYFAAKVHNNLNWLEAYAGRTSNPFGVVFPDKRPENQWHPSSSWIALWEQEYLAWAIDRANRHGLVGGTAVRNRVAQLQVRLLTSQAAGYLPNYGAPYLLVVGRRTAAGLQFFTSPQEIFAATFGTPPSPAESMVGTYGPEAWLTAQMGIDLQLPGAQAALQYLQGYRDEYNASLTEDRHRRSGWAIEPWVAPSVPPKPPPPAEICGDFVDNNGNGQVDENCPVACAVSNWSSWQSAGAWSSCSNNQQLRPEQRTRSVLTPPAFGGAACPVLQETRTAVQACSMPAPPAEVCGDQIDNDGDGQVDEDCAPPPPPRVACQMSTWSAWAPSSGWGACTAGEESRLEMRTRTIAVPASNGGAACGPATDMRTVVRACNMPPAEVCGDQIDNDGDGQVDEGCAPPPPVDCQMSAWSAWASSSAWGACTAGEESQLEVRTRTIAVPASNGGAACGPVSDTRTAIRACQAPPAEVCGDSIDNDQDGQIDEDCVAPPEPSPVPSAPGRLSARVRNTTVNLTWRAPIAGAAPTGYVIEAGVSPGSAAYSVAVGRQTAVNIPNVGVGKYYVRVRATNSIGVSAPSNEAVVTVGCSTRPGKVGELKSAVSGGVVTFTWTDPDGCSDTSYKLVIGSAPGQADVGQVTTQDSSVTAMARPGNYYASVIAQSTQGIGDVSDEISVTISSNVCAAPNVELKLDSHVRQSTVNLTWDSVNAAAALETDALNPLFYVLEVGSQSGASNLATYQLGRTTTLSATAPTGTYYLRVRAVNACGVGRASNEQVIRIP